MNERGDEVADGSSAWKIAADYGIDMSLLLSNLALTPWERLVRHGRVLATAQALRQAMEQERSAEQSTPGLDPDQEDPGQPGDQDLPGPPSAGH